MTTDTTARVSGTIKALQWEDGTGSILARARYNDDCGEYVIWADLTLFGCRKDGFGPYVTLDAAKAAAQADYNARILAAIQPDPEPQPCVAERAETETQAALRDTSDPQEPQPVAKVGELAIIIRMLARHVPNDKQIKAKAVDYLTRHGLQGSPLRDDATPSSAGMVSVEAAAVDNVLRRGRNITASMRIARDAIGNDADLGHLEAIALKYVRWQDLAFLDAALRALAGERG